MSTAVRVSFLETVSRAKAYLQEHGHVSRGGVGQSAGVTPVGLHLAGAGGAKGAKFGSATMTSWPSPSRQPCRWMRAGRVEEGLARWHAPGGRSGTGPAVGRPHRCRPLPAVIRPRLGDAARAGTGLDCPAVAGGRSPLMTGRPGGSAARDTVLSGAGRAAVGVRRPRPG